MLRIIQSTKAADVLQFRQKPHAQPMVRLPSTGGFPSACLGGPTEPTLSLPGRESIQHKQHVDTFCPGHGRNLGDGSTRSCTGAVGSCDPDHRMW